MKKIIKACFAGTKKNGVIIGRLKLHASPGGVQYRKVKKEVHEFQRT